MNPRNVVAGILAVLLLLGAAPCQLRGPHVPMRIYDLERGLTIAGEVHDFDEARGTITALLPTGESLTGEYSMFHRAVPFPGRPLKDLGSGTNGHETDEFGSVMPGEGEASWPEAYGFGRDSKARPVGTAVLVGNRGTVLQVVLYNADYHDEFADGVGRDNKGRWYRVFIGDLDFPEPDASPPQSPWTPSSPR
jgi:hypothetical protein